LSAINKLKAAGKLASNIAKLADGVKKIKLVPELGK